MEYRHDTVLREESVAVFSPLHLTRFLDGTLGGGGFSLELLKAADDNLQLIGLDVDPAAISAASVRLAQFAKRSTLMRRSYVEVAEVLSELGIEAVDGMLLDIGMSSPLLEGDRGFSYRKDGPLDMRMDPESPVTAKGLLAVHNEQQLARIFWDFGDIRGSRNLAKAVKLAVRANKMDTTSDLVGVVKGAFPNAGSKLLARTFQALRIAVNSELDNLESFLASAPQCLAVGGRLAVISFHSLEDRIVKHTFRSLAKEGPYKVGTRKPIGPGREEVAANPRARSAKLRWLERVE
jgi:16S rRNA (cytosine1402-N4)-methyltransferase